MKTQGLLDLNEALQHPGKKIAVDVVTELAEDPEIELIGSVTGYLEAVSTGNLLLLTGEFQARIILDCARCAGPIEVEVPFEIEEQFPVEGVAACYGMNDFARVVPDEPYPLFEGNSLIVDTLLRQDLLVAMPIQPLCQYGWDGDCPRAQQKSIGNNPAGHPGLQKLRTFTQPEGAGDSEARKP